MTALLWTWILSLAGAALFFAAGAALTSFRRASASPLGIAAGSYPSARPDPLVNPVARTEASDRETTAELILSEVQAARAALERELAMCAAERTRLEQELARSRQQLEHELAVATAERDELSARVQTLTQPAAADPEVAGLRQELSLAREALRSRGEQLEQLREQNARLHRADEELARTKRELAALNDQVRTLRAEAYSNRPPRPSARPNPTAPLRPANTHGRALQSIVDSETESGHAKSAVIADELGLLVAASGPTGEYFDALAALGAYLADVGTKTRDVLPLHNLSQVVVRDDHDVTLTVRPLASEDPGLALVTLAVAPPSVANETSHR